jgi:hypothetical protein
MELIHLKTCGSGCKHLQRFYANLKLFKVNGKEELRLHRFTVGTNLIL